jgi:hypothetical protein
MNKLIVILLLPLCALAQHDFKANNNHVEWTHVYNDTISLKDIEAQLRTNISHNEEINVTATSITGTTDFMPMISNTTSMAPAFKQPVKFNYRVEFKENRYRVFINNIVFKGIAVTIYGVTNDNDTYANTSLIRNRDGELRKNKQAQRVFERLHESFLNTFTYNPPDKW